MPGLDAKRLLHRLEPEPAELGRGKARLVRERQSGDPQQALVLDEERREFAAEADRQRRRRFERRAGQRTGVDREQDPPRAIVCHCGLASPAAPPYRRARHARVALRRTPSAATQRDRSPCPAAARR
jgi:hypothetical protein